MRHVYCDIDGVLGRENPGTLYPLINEALKIGIEPEELGQLLTPAAFYGHPLIQSYRATVGAATFEQRRKLISIMPSYLLTCALVPGAVQALCTLAHDGNVWYCTCRKTEIPDFNLRIAHATHLWLADAHFPNPEQVIFCRTIRQKLEYIADQLAESGEEGIFIEDQYEEVLAELPTLSDERRSVLRSSLVVWAFGARSVLPAASGLLAGLVALPSWERRISTSRMPVPA
jgi:hypothetical protein